eukprot:IDg13677t1
MAKYVHCIAFQSACAPVRRPRRRVQCCTVVSDRIDGRQQTERRSDSRRDSRREPARVALLLQYRGTHFHGWAAQKDSSLRTVQGEVERALVDAGAPEELLLSAASHTDAGAHARAQVAHFDSPPMFAEVR